MTKRLPCSLPPFAASAAAAVLKAVLCARLRLCSGCSLDTGRLSALLHGCAVWFCGSTVPPVRIRRCRALLTAHRTARPLHRSDAPAQHCSLGSACQTISIWVMGLIKGSEMAADQSNVHDQDMRKQWPPPILNQVCPELIFFSRGNQPHRIPGYQNDLTDGCNDCNGTLIGLLQLATHVPPAAD